MQTRFRTTAVGALAAALLATAPVPAAAAPAPPAPAAPAPPAPAPAPAAPAVADDDGAPYPRQAPLAEPAPDADDASLDRGALAYHEIAPALNDLMAASDLVSAEVVGESTQGREIYLVTVTAPETAAESAQQDAWREAVKHSPAAAAADPALAEGYKLPVWFNGNIHGNEWEGTDATLAFVEDLVGDVAAGDPAATALLEDHRLYFTVANNPDGRVAGTRATALNLDPNRDFVTSTTPETRVVRGLADDLQPAFFVDLHGYTGVLQVEPTGPPQGENYEHDLLMPHAYAAALRIEEDVVAAGIEGNPLTPAGGIRIPYRDIADGWDGWPPVFTAQYVAFQGAIAYTVELPLGRTADRAESARRTRVNTTVGEQVIGSTTAYVAEHRGDLLGNQIEIFRRGLAGEPLRQIPAQPDGADYPGPDQWAAEWDAADVTGTTFPRAYVVPRGERQASETNAATLVDHLLAHGVEVDAAAAPFTAGGVRYPAGSYVVDMHQPLRGLANVLLADGSDVSGRVPSMYDISAWSLGRLWGATVTPVGDTTGAPIGVVTTPVLAAAPTGSAPAGGHLRVQVGGAAEVTAVNALLDAGVRVTATGDGAVVVRPEDAAAARPVLAVHGVTATRTDARALRGPTKPLADLRVGYTSAAAYGGEDLLTLTELGFDAVRVTAQNLSDGGVDLAEVDVLWLGAPLRFGPGQEAGRRQVADYLAAGKGFAGRAEAGAALAADFGVLDVGVVTAPGAANGIVAVQTPDDGLLGATARSSAFAYAPSYFTDLGENVTVEQAYALDPLVSGHWRPRPDGTGGPDDAAGQPSVVSAVSATGARAVLFGTHPTFRTHPRGMWTDLATALFWAGPDGERAPGAATPRTEPAPLGVIPADAGPDCPPSAGPNQSDRWDTCA
ncbi:M14 family zinc carboxypeptidase [Georgenia sp. AZ-5]|uniref:M14 family zinc carboxypeptidase n=1 Tax=Georgenia sp. AZ-5 TaxID=3367526 RepID=UPI0037542A47